jgi:hypothetical protein
LHDPSPGDSGTTLWPARGRSRGTPIRRDARDPSGPRLPRSRPLADIRGLEAALGWPYSGPRTARTSGVNAGELPGRPARSCRARQQVTGSLILAPRCRSGTLTQKRSLVQSSMVHTPNAYAATGPDQEPGCLGGPRSPATEQPGIMGLRISPPDNGGYTTPATCPSQRLPHAASPGVA